MFHVIVLQEQGCCELVLGLISRFEVKGPSNYGRKNNGMVYLRAQGLISIMSPRAYFNNKHKGLFQ